MEEARTPLDSAVATALRRLLPLLVGMHVIAFIDRVNITFAEDELTRDLGLSATMFGLASGIFFLGYLVLEVPSNLVLHRVGARRWLARIMITWGVFAAAAALAWDGTSLIVFRLLLGFAEAGFFPGVIYFLLCWFPDSDRARATGYFMTGVAIAAVLGGPFSGGLLELDGVLGLTGWQWLFIGQGTPAVLIGLYVLRALPDTPREADWLDPAETAALERQLAEESSAREALEGLDLRAALTDRRVLRLGAVYFCSNFAGYGLIFWLADIIERVGELRPIELGLVATIPFAFGTAGLYVLGRAADRAADRRRPVAAGLALGAIGTVLLVVLPPVPAMLGAVIATFGLLGVIPAFWTLPTGMLSGRAAAGGIALVNTIGVTGGLFGPVVVGILKDATGSLDAGLLTLAGALVVGTAVVLRARVAPRPGEMVQPAPASSG
ncbi:MAG: MFS transporter [Thermoleophilaceae bacterium]